MEKSRMDFLANPMHRKRFIIKNMFIQFWRLRSPSVGWFCTRYEGRGSWWCSFQSRSETLGAKSTEAGEDWCLSASNESGRKRKIPPVSPFSLPLHWDSSYLIKLLWVKLIYLKPLDKYLAHSKHLQVPANVIVCYNCLWI